MVIWIFMIAIVLITIFLILSQPKQGQQSSNQPINPNHQLAGSPNHSIVDLETFHENIQDLLKNNQKIRAVKLVRQQMGCGLKEALDYVEDISQSNPIILLDAGELDELRQAVLELMSQNQVVEAIKYVRCKTGWGLKESKDYVNQLREF